MNVSGAVMQTVLMAVAVVRDGDKVLLRKMNPQKSPYKELWALFGGRIVGDGSVVDALNSELSARWGFTVRVDKKLWWDEEIKVDHDGEEKRFIYLDVICSILSGEPRPGEGELLEWVLNAEAEKYDLNPPTRILLNRLGNS